MIVTVDDFRYFGTDSAVATFEKNLPEGLVVTMLEGDSGNDFLSIEIVQDVENHITEIKQPKYWEKGMQRFNEYFPSGPRSRKTPLPEGINLEPATPSEIDEAKNLPFRQLIGFLQFGATTKPEIKYALSVLSQHNKGWSTLHFGCALRTLEYGYESREMGTIYSDLDKHGVNMLYAYADSNYRPPLSQGARYTMANGGVISSTSSRHKKTNTSTTDAEAEEAYLASNDVVALRKIFEEIGLKQIDPTTIYCDNQPAIHIMENKGSIAKKSKAMATQIFALRDRMIDHEVELKYLSTVEMAADIGTKALGKVKFQLFRDIITGYALVRASKRNYTIPIMAISLQELQT